MRLRNNAKLNEYIKNSKYLISTFPFKLDSNCIIELGMGKGEMLTEMAKKMPNKIFIGIEKFATVSAKAIKRAEILGLNNFFVINDDIGKLESFFIGKTNLIWLTFSDPWPKKRHFKRRLTYKNFLDKYKLILNSDGIIKLKSDNDFFYNYSLDSLNEYGANIIYKTNDFYQSEKIKDNIATGYEKKWVSKNKNINYLEFNFKNN